MTNKIKNTAVLDIRTATVLDGLIEWMRRGRLRRRWGELLQVTLDDHMYAFCDLHGLDSFDELLEKIGDHWGNSIYDMALMDFLTRETEDGNVVDLYLKQQGWKEKAIPKAYLRAVRNSVMSLYEVSDIRPGESFLARDLIQGGDPILVEEREGTKSIRQWEQFAMRIVEVRGHNIITSGVLPFKPELAERVIGLILRNAVDDKIGFEEMSEGHDEDPEPELVQDLAHGKGLKIPAPLFSEVWLMGQAVDPADVNPPTVVNAEGDELEFIQLRYSIAKSATQNQLRELFNDAPDMDAASSLFWNWVAPPDEKPTSPPKHDGDLTYHVHLENQVVLGTIELKGETLEGNVNSVERADRLQERLKVLLGDLVTKHLSVHQTLEQVMAEKHNRPSPGKQQELPPEVESQVIEDVYDQHYRKVLDKPLPMLDGKSPRAAAKTPEGRAKVVKWLKILEMKGARARQSKPIGYYDYDFTWMWQELGVASLRK